ncbi:MAG TPA: YwiC-like family protein [Thermoanaerobaculia bacterium]|nr:YwiC-like family protein [Thermoanaerobaculia bacterium]
MTQQAVSLRKVLLPAEHGSWGFVLEPLLLGLLVAPSRAGLAIALGVLALFLARQPLKLAAADRLRRTFHPRTALSLRWGSLLGLTAAALFCVAAITTRPYFLIPLVAAAPIILVQFLHDIRREGRALVAEVAGATAAGAAASAIAIAGAAAPSIAAALWALLALRAIPSILYVRTRLRLERGQAPSLITPVAAHLLAIMIATTLWRVGVAPPLAIAAFVILFLRCAIGLSPIRRRAPAKQIGIAELVYGAVMILLTGIGYRL